MADYEYNVAIQVHSLTNTVDESAWQINWGGLTNFHHTLRYTYVCFMVRNNIRSCT